MKATGSKVKVFVTLWCFCVFFKQNTLLVEVYVSTYLVKIIQIRERPITVIMSNMYINPAEVQPIQNATIFSKVLVKNRVRFRHYCCFLLLGSVVLPIKTYSPLPSSLYGIPITVKMSRNLSYIHIASQNQYI